MVDEYNTSGKMYAPIDKDIVKLVKELNKLSFLRTTHSCSGHDGHPYISFYILNLAKGFSFLYDVTEHLNAVGKKSCGYDLIAQFSSDFSRNAVSLYLNLNKKAYKESTVLWNELLKFVKKYPRSGRVQRAQKKNEY